MRYRFIALFVSVFLLGAGSTVPVYALDPYKSINQFGLSVWTRQNGLPSNAVSFALQTHDGYLWLGTPEGLFRFDGVDFRSPDSWSETDMTRLSISTLYETRDSTLWIGTIYAGLRCLKNGKLIEYDLKHGFYDTQVKMIYQSRRGNIWVGTALGLFLFHDGSFKPVILNPNNIGGIVEDTRGRIWIGTQDGVRIIDDNDPSKMTRLGVKDGLPYSATTALFTDRESNVWVGTYNGLACWTGKKITRYTIADGLVSNFINVIFQDRDGNIWVGTPVGLCRRSGSTWTRFTSLGGLSDNNVLTITEDREGSIWVGTSNGLNQIKNLSFTTYTVSDGLPNDNLSGIHETADGSRYFFSPQGETITRFMPSGKREVFKWYIGPTYLARNGSLWMGQGGTLLNIRQGKITRYDTSNGLPNKWISAITEDRKSLIFYGDHEGIFRFKNGRVLPYRIKKGTGHPASEYIVCLYQQNDSVLWIGGTNWLAKMENGDYTKYTTDDGLAGNWISSIYDDNRGSLWISSPQGGLSRYRNGKFKAYKAKDGLFTDEIYSVLGDNAGNLWMGSPRGIGCVQRADLDSFDAGLIKRFTTQVFTTADGMKTDECFGGWQPASSRSRDGSLWFATKRGAVHIIPSGFRKNMLRPPVLIEKVVVDERRFNMDRQGNFAPGSDRFEFHYTALCLIAPEKVRFKYKLEGYDNDWIDAGSRRVAYYTNLPPGEYTFKVMACNNDGLWNETGAAFSFVLQPRFYETAWFIALVVVALGGLVFGLMRLRLWQMLKNEKELQKRIQEALANIKTLSGLVPICANCKKIRDDQGYWDQLDEYVQSHSSVTFSHSICPDCADKLYPGILAHKHKPKDKKPPTST